MPFPEIQALKENLTTNRRDAVRAVKERLSSLLAASDWNMTECFFREYKETLGGDTSALGIVGSEFRSFVDALMPSEDFELVLMLDRLQSFFWFQSIENVEYKKGVIAEKMSRFGQHLVRLIKLQDARNHYRRANRRDDVTRVQRLLSNAVRNTNIGEPVTILPDSPIAVRLNGMITHNLNLWLERDNYSKMELLGRDFSGIRPAPFDPSQEQSQPGDFFSSGAAQGLGVVRAIGYSPADGRVNVGEMALASERIHYNSNDAIITIFLSAFVNPVKEWLLVQDGEERICQFVGGELMARLNWDENATEIFMEAITAWLSGDPHIAFALWIPFFEDALRKRLGDLGEDILNPQERPGIENFVLFDGLLGKATGHFELQTIEYWRKVFSTKNGLGWNLRNSFCHGLLSMKAMRYEVYTLAIFHAILFLLHPISRENSI